MKQIEHVPKDSVNGRFVQFMPGPTSPIATLRWEVPADAVLGGHFQTDRQAHVAQLDWERLLCH